MVSVVAGNVLFVFYGFRACSNKRRLRRKVYTRSTRGLHEVYTSSTQGLPWQGTFFFFKENGFRRFYFACLWFPPWQGTFSFYGFRRFLMVSGCYRTAAVSPMETVKRNARTFPRQTKWVCVYIYIYTHTHTQCVFIIYI